MTADASKPPRPTTEPQLPCREHPLSGPAIPCLRSQDLFGKSREIMIEHDGGYYRLRVTYSNKLILTK